MSRLELTFPVLQQAIKENISKLKGSIDASEKDTRKILISNVRVYVAAENLLTLTGYHGFDPEIASGGTSLGIDYGVYPQARTFTAGISVAF